VVGVENEQPLTPWRFSMSLTETGVVRLTLAAQRILDEHGIKDRWQLEQAVELLIEDVRVLLLEADVNIKKKDAE
jgi:hypothetical protein